MSALVKRAAGGLTVLDSLWVFYLVYAAETVMINCPANGCPGPNFGGAYLDIAFVLAAVLLVDGLLGLWGAQWAYSAGAVLSAVLLLMLGYEAWASMPYAYLANEAYMAAAGAGISALALVLNTVASRSRVGLSEQANPMNLPVFG